MGWIESLKGLDVAVAIAVVCVIGFWLNQKSTYKNFVKPLSDAIQTSARTVEDCVTNHLLTEMRSQRKATEEHTNVLTLQAARLDRLCDLLEKSQKAGPKGPRGRAGPKGKPGRTA